MTEEQVFLGVLELADPFDRTAYLDVVCGGDAELRRQVEELLAAHFKAGEFLDEPAAKQMGAVAATPVNENNGILHTHLRGDAVNQEQKPDEEPVDLHFLQPSSRPDSLGRIGHYEVLQVLGQGGCGIVLRSFDDVLQRVVAVKVLLPQMAATSPARKRFLREARSSAQVRHENVVQVYAVEEQPLPYLVMEFIPGETLRQRLDRIGPLDVPEVLRVGRQIAEGLAAAHATDLIHRDIKPENVLLEGGHLRVKISDFGLARTADDASISQSGIIAGTPMFMAPEQALGQPLDQRADVFSLGSVLYQMVTGRPPFRANGMLAVLKRVAEDTPRHIREVIPETPQWLCDVISKLHAKKPEDRFQSAREVADLLADCEAQIKVHGRLKDFSRIPQGKPVEKRSGKWKWLAAAALLLPVLALTLAELGGVTHLLRGEEPTLASTQPGGPAPIAKIDPPKKDARSAKLDPATALGKDNPTVTPDAPTADPDRVAAWYVLSIGGRVKIDGQNKEINAGGDLPLQAFRLTSVYLDINRQVNDAGLATLKNCKHLAHLDLYGCGKITDAGLAVFKGCKGLTYLDLGLTGATATGLALFKDCKNLTFLRVPTVTDAALADFQDCQHLTGLNLYGAPITDAGLELFKNCKGLTFLNLYKTKITDGGLALVKDWKDLTFLQLGKTQVTDAGLVHLAGLDKLTTLDLIRTTVTAKGVEGVAEALPKCRITWDGGKIEPR